MSVAIGRVEAAGLSRVALNKQMRADLLSRMATGIPVSMSVIGTSIEAGSGGISYMDMALLKASSQGLKIGLKKLTSMRAVGGAVWSGGGGPISGQLTLAIADEPDILYCGAMVNDHASWTTANTSNSIFTAELAKYKIVADSALARGIMPMFSGDISAAGGARAGNASRWNRILARWCELNGYIHVDMRSIIARPQDGAAPAGTYTTDGTHPNGPGARRLAAEFFRQLKGDATVTAWECYHRSDYSNASRLPGANLVENGCPVNPSTGVADAAGWSSGTASLATEYSGGVVNLVRAAVGGETVTTVYTANYATPGVIAGDTMRIGYHKRATVEGTGSKYTLRFNPTWTAATDLHSSVIDTADSVNIFELDTPAGTDGIAISLFNHAGEVAAATGSVSLGNLAAVNLEAIDDFLRAGGFI